MTSVSVPDPVVRRSGRPPAATGALKFSALERDLRRRVDGEVRFDASSRGAYSTHASNYRQVPCPGPGRRPGLDRPPEALTSRPRSGQTVAPPAIRMTAERLV
jgi:hypothetical protein